MESAQQNEVVAQQMVQALEKTVDEQLNKLNNLDATDIESIRAQRLRMKKIEVEEKISWVRNGHGSVQEITDEREFFEAAKSSRRLVALFYRTGSAVCDSMVQHTRRLAESHMETKFLTIDVAKTPFLVDRLDIFVLPTMVTIEEGSTKNKFKGYDAFGGTANIHTGVIERVLKSVGALDKTPIAEGSGAQDEQMEETGNDSDLDWE